MSNETSGNSVINNALGTSGGGSGNGSSDDAVSDLADALSSATENHEQYTGFIEPLTNQLNDMWVGFVEMVPSLAIAFIVLIITAIIAAIAKKIVEGVVTRSHTRASLQALFQTMAKVLVWIVGILLMVTIIFPSMTPAKLLATLGLGSVAIGFAFKDIFENFLAGILIMLRKPMRIGDYIECDTVEGNVEHIAIRDTYVRKLSNELILVPNSYLFKNPVFVKTDRDKRRFEITCGVAYDVNADHALEIIKKAVKSLDIIDNDKPVQVFACEFNSSSIDYNVRWWTKSKQIDMHESRDQVIRAIKNALDDEGIEIPFPYRTLTFKEPLPVKSDGAFELEGPKEGNDNKGEKKKKSEKKSGPKDKKKKAASK